MKPSLAPLAMIGVALLTSCNDEATGHVVKPQVVPTQESTRRLEAKQLDAAPSAVEPPCESARLLKVRTVEMAEARIGGPVAPTDEDGTRPAGLATKAIYYLSLDCGGKAYIARVSSGTPGFEPDELGAAATLHLRAEGEKVFMKSEGGTEFEATLAATPSLDSQPPGQ